MSYTTGKKKEIKIGSFIFKRANTTGSYYAEIPCRYDEILGMVFLNVRISDHIANGFNDYDYSDLKNGKIFEDTVDLDFVFDSLNKENKSIILDKIENKIEVIKCL